MAFIVRAPATAPIRRMSSQALKGLAYGWTVHRRTKHRWTIYR
jgi:hypothetical protein